MELYAVRWNSLYATPRGRCANEAHPPSYPLPRRDVPSTDAKARRTPAGRVRDRARSAATRATNGVNEPRASVIARRAKRRVAPELFARELVVDLGDVREAYAQVVVRERDRGGRLVRARAAAAGRVVVVGAAVMFCQARGWKRPRKPEVRTTLRRLWQATNAVRQTQHAKLAHRARSAEAGTQGSHTGRGLAKLAPERLAATRLALRTPRPSAAPSGAL